MDMVASIVAVQAIIHQIVEAKGTSFDVTQVYIHTPISDGHGMIG
jgi:hypothetical protein